VVLELSEAQVINTETHDPIGSTIDIDMGLG
jgi:hypothetical protein